MNWCSQVAWAEEIPRMVVPRVRMGRTILENTLVQFFVPGMLLARSFPLLVLVQ
jgi:hypothetical protein